MKYWFKVLQKIIEVLSFLTRQILRSEKKRELLIKITGFVLFYPFIKGFIEIIMEILDPLIDNFDKNPIKIKILLILMLLLTIVLLFQLLFEFLIGKPLKTDNFIDLNKKVSLRERIFALLPFIWFLIEVTVGLLDNSVDFVESYLPMDISKVIVWDFLYPLAKLYMSLPGLTFGILGNYLFYVKFFYISRSKNKFTYFVRYYYMQSILMGTLCNFTTHCFYLLYKYEIPSEYLILIGLFHYMVYLFSIIYVMTYIIIGKENKFPFMDEAIQYHIGRRKKKK